MDARLPAVPSHAQLEQLENGLSLFVHFNINPWHNYEHNCVREHGWLRKCIPASVFNPPVVDTDQWALAAVAMGAGEMCLTAHHEGGFCLWDTKHSNYSVMHSPYGRDVVDRFVVSCRKFGLRPCFYMGPNSNGWLTHHQRVPTSVFVHQQLGMTSELLSNYGTISRLWWDHYPRGCAGWAACPNGSFPEAWPQFINLVRRLSPTTIICPGPDCTGHAGDGDHESGNGWYPAWLSCQPNRRVSEMYLSCDEHDASAVHSGFSPFEATATMANGWFCKGNGSATVDPSPLHGISSHAESAKNTFWDARRMWDSYMASVGIGWINTLNSPPCTTGRLPDPLVLSMSTFGKSLRGLLLPIAPPVENVSVACGPDAPAIVLDLLGHASGAVDFNALMIREDLSTGQRIKSYTIETYAQPHVGWATLPSCTGAAQCDPFGRGPGGVHGRSVGARMIDFVGGAQRPVSARKVRLRCTSSIAPDGRARIRSFSAHRGHPPPPI